MRKKLDDALERFRSGFHVVNWYGRTRREFWTWFGEQEVTLLALAESPEEQTELEEELLESRAMADDGGFVGPPELDDALIEEPPPLVDLSGLDARIDGVHKALAEIVALPKQEQLPAFALIANPILEAAYEHRSHAWSRLQRIAQEAGLIPEDDESGAE